MAEAGIVVEESGAPSGVTFCMAWSGNELCQVSNLIGPAAPTYSIDLRAFRAATPWAYE